MKKLKTVQFLVIILYVLFCILVSCGKKNREQKKEGIHAYLYDDTQAREKYGIWVNENVLCENVSNRSPVNPATEFETMTSMKVYFYTRIGCHKAGESIFHRYSVYRENIDNGKALWEQVHITELTLKSTNWRTWSYKTVYPGQWRVDVVAPDKEGIIKKHVFNVIGTNTEKPELEIMPDYDITQLSLIDSVLCTSIENNEPVDKTLRFRLKEGETYAKIWLWMKFQCLAVPAGIFLRWSRWVDSVDGKGGWVQVDIYKLAIKGKIWRMKGVKSCSRGKGRVDILGPDGKTRLKTYEFEVESPATSDAET